MRNTLKIIGLIILTSISFAGGIFVTSVLHLGSPIITVNLHNDSTKEISSLRLTHEHGLIDVQKMAAGATRTLRFFAPAESSYKITLVFTDGKSLEGRSTYVEAGYSISETITQEEIKTEFDHLAYHP
ncbi:MAG: hypothetical protein HP497_10450 [Nitrospira sp.]|nr:hypothetical protein [Nitrospira sp.]